VTATDRVIRWSPAGAVGAYELLMVIIRSAQAPADRESETGGAVGQEMRGPGR
jgi:hypothetical protein